MRALCQEWVRGIGLDRLKFATHSMRRTKVTLIYRRTGNLRAAQLLLGHQKIESGTLASRSTMTLRSQRRSKSEIPGQC